MNTPDHTHDVELDALYRDTVLDHFRAPRGHKILDRVDLVREGHNPVCGDRLTMSVKLSDAGIEDVAVHCKGCAISVASASMLAEMLPGMSRDQAKTLAEAFRRMMHGQPPPPDLDIGDLDALEGVKNFPVRVKCALLAWMTLIDALKAIEAGANSTGGITDLEKPGE
jgi:nitrogen fixation NifU-like protein